VPGSVPPGVKTVTPAPGDKGQVAVASHAAAAAAAVVAGGGQAGAPASEEPATAEPRQLTAEQRQAAVLGASGKLLVLEQLLRVLHGQGKRVLLLAHLPKVGGCVCICVCVCVFEGSHQSFV